MASRFGLGLGLFARLGFESREQVAEVGLDSLDAESFRLELMREDAGLQAYQAAHSPLGVGDVADEAVLEAADGVEFFLELGDQTEKLLGVFVGQHGVTGEQPCLEAFWLERALPSAVRGPVLRFAFLRFAFF